MDDRVRDRFACRRVNDILLRMDVDVQTEFLDQILDPLSRCLTPEVARRVVELRANPLAQRRVDELAEKCNNGELTADERAEYEVYVVASSMIAVLQAKARRLLSGQTAA
jgi:hypothetical protein